MTKTSNIQSSLPKCKAFRRGLNNLRVADYPAARDAIKAVLGTKNIQLVAYYADGKGNLDIDKARQIEEIFLSYGVTDIWGEK